MKIEKGLDRFYVIDWVDRKMKLKHDFPTGIPESGDSDDFNPLFRARDSWDGLDRDDRLAVEAWCNTHLSDKQIKQLQNAVRNARWRHNSKSGKGTKKINLDYHAWWILHELSKADGVTLSEVIISRLEKEYHALPDARYEPSLSSTDTTVDADL